MDPYGPKRTTPGGKAVPFATSLRIELKSHKKDKIEATVKDVKKRTGQSVTATVIKSKVSKPYVETQFEILY